MDEPASESAGTIETHANDGVLELRIRNPDRANALDEGMLGALAEALAGASDRGATVVLLGGAGERNFSAGLDLGDEEGVALAARLRRGEAAVGEAARAVEAAPIPVVAVVNGAAMGGALELAAACDWRIAAPTARLGMPAARLGVVYTAEGLSRFVRLLGPARARMLFLTGAPVDARSAFALGLVDEVVDDPSGLWPRAREAAAQVAAAAPLAVAGTRRIVDSLSAGPGSDTDAVAREWRERAFASEDLREGLAAFRERRAPRFAGR